MHVPHSMEKGFGLSLDGRDDLGVGMTDIGHPEGRRQIDEAILIDSARHLVEGARTNLFCVLTDGTLATPPIDSGAVAGIARAVCLERIPEISERLVSIGDLERGRELIAVNAVRGAKPITALDGKPVGKGAPGPWSERLADALASD